MPKDQRPLNKQIILKRRPIGLPKQDTWGLIQSKIPQLKEGEFLIQCEYISLDPAMRGWLNDVKSYISPVQIDAVMRAGGVGKIIASKNKIFNIGDCVSGQIGVQQYLVTNGIGFHKVNSNLPLAIYTGTLGMTGMTAYFGILEVGKLKEGDAVLVSGAAGAVGSVVGQIAKIKNCKVVGIAGGKEKCEYLINELGFDAAIDYKNDDVKAKIAIYFPTGIDVYFDNIGGDLLDAALGRLALHARIVICGAISQYNNTKSVTGPSNYLSLLVSRASMKGMVVFDYTKDYQKAAIQLGVWIAEGKLKSKETIYEGIENFHETFLRLFSGEKLGKLVLKVR
ncbi:MAG: NADP-dependent oxidoreductase [Flavobacteriaceae bacterium]|nr:NADP-dependent oxidoreductase [Flavobacteriaceae bacterium]